MAALLAVAIVRAILPRSSDVARWLACAPDLALRQPWRLVTSGLVTDLGHYASHLIFSVLGFYFIGQYLERHWGTRRYAWFIGISVVLGNLLALCVGALVPDGAPNLHPAVMFGPMVAVTGVCVAWSREFGAATVNLYFLIPVKGKHLLWFTLALCVLNVLQPSSVPEGVVAPFAGILTGLLLSGSPSLARTAWLRARLALLRRQAAHLTVKDVLAGKKVVRRPARPGAPPLRVVQGGASLEDILKKRSPPKDKRYLN
jgi:membrane associated rhomboid family serine protease